MVAKAELISVIIPTFKRSDSLDRAIESIENQTYPNVEILVVDDNAEFPEQRKATRDIVSKHKGVHLIENERNLGGGVSRNVGIEHAKGRYIAFLDDDDEYLSTKLEEQYAYYQNCNNDNIAMVYCYAEIIKIDGKSYYQNRDLEGNLLVENAKNCIAATSWWFCPKEKLLSVGGFEDISSRQDASLLMKFFLKGYDVVRVPKVLLKYYWHGSSNGISTISERTLLAEIQYREMYINNASNLDSEIAKEIDYIFAYRIAQQYILLGKRAGAFRELKTMIMLHPFNKEVLRITGGILFNMMYRIVSKFRGAVKVGYEKPKL